MKARMQTRILSFLVCLAMLIGWMPASALAVGQAHAGHSNGVAHAEAVQANCTTPGNIEFWYCDYYTCRKYYSDAEMTQEISVADAIISPGVHSQDCVGCAHSVKEETFQLFTPSEHPYYDAYDYSNSGLHSLTPYLEGFVFLLVGEDAQGNLYAMGNQTNADGSRQAVNITANRGTDGSITVDSDTVEYFTYRRTDGSYTFSPDNGYMTIMDGKLLVHSQAIKDQEDALRISQSIRFEQDTGMSDYAAHKGYLFSWNMDSGMLSFDASDPKFVASKYSDGVYGHNIMLYMQRCEHTGMVHTPAKDATCTEDGNLEYWYCDDCQLYYTDGEGSAYLELPEDAYSYESYLTLYAQGHNYVDGACEVCGRPEHADAQLIEVEPMESSCFEPGIANYWYCEECGRYLDESKKNAYWEEMDAAKKPATGHAFHADTGSCDHCGLANPVYTKVTSLDEINEEDMYIIVGEADGKYFALGGLNEIRDEEIDETWYVADQGNAVVVTPNADGTIGVLGQPAVSQFMLDINPEQFDCGLSEFALTTVMLKLPNHCIYPFQTNAYENGYMGVPRYADGQYGRWDGMDWIIDLYTTAVDENTYTDGIFGGEIGQTHAQQLESGNIGEHVAEGNLLLYNSSFVSVGGAMFTLRLREYNGQYSFICGEDWALEGAGDWDSETGKVPTNDTQYAIWLYRYDAAPVNTHTCDFTKWAEDKDADTHSRTCQDPECGKTETMPHTWDKGVEEVAPMCGKEGRLLLTCQDCGATKTEPIPALEHIWGKWVDDGAGTHSHSCQQPGCLEVEHVSHQWSDWESAGENTHTKFCDLCSGSREEDHFWGEGVVTKEATHLEEGVRTFTCGACADTKTESIPKTTDHAWSDWEDNKNGTHTRSCPCNETETKDCVWDAGVVTTQPSHIAEGEKTYTCADCSGTKTESIPKTTDHEWSDWEDNKNGTHTRSCACNETETKDCVWNAGVVTTQPSHIAEGEKTFTCQVCSGTKTEAIAKTTDHAWSDWEDNKNGTHTRSCPCNETETKDCVWDAGVVTTQPSHIAEGEKTFTCQVCSGTKTEAIAKTTEHEWSDWSDNNDGTHTRSCRCNAKETKDCTYDAGVVTTPSTHYEEGVKTFTCTVCGHTKTEVVEKLAEHEWTEWTANNDGKTHTRLCKCQASETLDHTWSNWAKQPDGSYKRVCGDCQAFETMTLDEEKPVNTTPVDTPADTNLTDTDVELIDKVLTDEEQSQVAKGAEVKVYLKVEDISNEAPAEHKEEAEAKAGTDEIGMYLDIDLFKQVGSATETPVTETADAVNITITIPQELINTNSSVTRTYKIIRVHEDDAGKLITDVIDGDFDPETNTFTFQTDKFSTYALAYADKVAAPVTPPSGDVFPVALLVSLVSLSFAAMAVLVILRKKEMAV